MPYSLDSSQTEEQTTEPGVLDKLGVQLKARGADIVSSAKKGMAGGLQGPKSGLNIAGDIGGAIGDVFGAVTEPLVSGLQKGMESVATKGIEKGIIGIQQGPIEKLGMSALKAGVDTWNRFKEAHPDVARGIEDIANVASAVPIVKGAAVTGKGVLSGTVKTLSSAGNISKKLGESAFSTVIPITNDVDAKAMQNYLAKNTLGKRVVAAVTGKDLGKPTTAAQKALEVGAYGTESMIGVKANRVANQLREIIQPILDKSKASIYKSELIGSAQNFVNSITEEGAKQRFRNALEKIVDEYKDLEEYIPVSKAQKIKTELNTLQAPSVFSKGKSGLDITNEYKSLKAMMANTIKEKTYERLGEGVKDAYKTWSKAMDLMELGIKDMRGKPVYGANFWGKLLDKTVVPIGTAGGQMLYSLGNMLQFKGRPGFKKFGDFVKDTFGEGQLLLDKPKTIFPNTIKEGSKIMSQPEATKKLIEQGYGVERYVPENIRKPIVLPKTGTNTETIDLRNIK